MESKKPSSWSVMPQHGWNETPIKKKKWITFFFADVCFIDKTKSLFNEIKIELICCASFIIIVSRQIDKFEGTKGSK